MPVSDIPSQEMTDIHCDEAAQHLLTARRTQRPGPRLSASCRPTNLQSALQIQQRVGDLLGQQIGGWKCALPTTDKLIVAPIYTPDISDQSPCQMFADSPSVKIEPELAFILCKDLPPRETPYSDSEVCAAILETRLAIELIGSRYAAPAAIDFPEMLADGLVNQGLFLGPVIPDALNQSLESVALTVSYNDKLLQLVGKHPDGHPLLSLYWLVAFLNARGQGLYAGQAIITGSYAGVLDVPLNAQLLLQFGDLGILSVQINQVTNNFKE